MEKKEMLEKLHQIKAITANMVITYDLGIQFDVMTSKGVCTNSGDVGNWPCYKMPVTEELRALRARIINEERVTSKDILKVEVCKNLLTYTNWGVDQSCVIEGEKLSNICKKLKRELVALDDKLEVFYAFVDLEDWHENKIVFFQDYDKLCEFFTGRFGSNCNLYEDMDDDDLQSAYDEAEENDWNGVAYKNFVPEDQEEQEQEQDEETE